MNNMLSVFEKITKQIINESKTKIVTHDIIQAWKQLFEIVKPELTKYVLYNSPSRDQINILFTMTTCKRLNLFKQTMNSIINSWQDLSLVDKFLIVDDNSSTTDRTEMVQLYPFVNFYMKNEEEKGHRTSMNIIYDKIIKSDPNYWIHIEDDFLFFVPMSYITTAIKGLDVLDMFNVKQIMFNRNYAETIDQINMPGNITYSDNNYSLHDYKVNGIYSQYWPNYSFRPSLIDVSAIKDIGNFDSPNTFFELDYAKKWTQKGYRTAFYNSITNIHIGRLCNTPGDNAYTLNETDQFNSNQFNNNQTNKNQSDTCQANKSHFNTEYAKVDKLMSGTDMNIKVINLKERTDRLNQVTTILNDAGIMFDRFEAVNGKEIVMTQDLVTLFRHNDFDYRRGVIGCALSHYRLWQELLKDSVDYYIILEDDVTFCNNFKDKLMLLTSHVDEYGLIFAGYHMNPTDKKLNSKYYEESDLLEIQELNTACYLGGTHCYIVSKKAAQKLLDYIEINGIRKGIDILMTKVQDKIKVYETYPFIAFADWVNEGNGVNSDIQYDYTPVPVHVSDNYIFLQGLDQMGNDAYHANGSVSKYDYERIAISIPGCVAFNTLGYFKNNITNLITSPYFSSTDGIYVLRDYYFDVFKKKG
jgi:GR25 family glycosyltransferase involved in LPS biosynthesis